MVDEMTRQYGTIENYFSEGLGSTMNSRKTEKAVIDLGT